MFLERETTELSQDSVRALKDYVPGQLAYDLRHTHATIMLTERETVHVVSARLAASR